MTSVCLCSYSARPAAAHLINLGFHQIPNYCRLVNSSSNIFHSTLIFRLPGRASLFDLDASVLTGLSPDPFHGYPKLLPRRFKNSAKLMIGKRLTLVRASNKPSEEPIGKTKAISSSDTSPSAQGPPFLTILAGIVVFALILWLIGSVVSWLIGLLGLVFSK